MRQVGNRSLVTALAGWFLLGCLSRQSMGASAPSPELLELPDGFTITYKMVENDPLISDGLSGSRSHATTAHRSVVGDNVHGQNGAQVDSTVSLTVQHGKLLYQRTFAQPYTDGTTKLTVICDLKRTITYSASRDGDKGSISPGTAVPPFVPRLFPGLNTSVWRLYALNEQVGGAIPGASAVYAAKVAAFGDIHAPSDPGHVELSCEPDGSVKVMRTDMGDEIPQSIWKFTEHKRFMDRWIGARMVNELHFSGRPSVSYTYTLESVSTKPVSDDLFSYTHWFKRNATITVDRGNDRVAFRYTPDTDLAIQTKRARVVPEAY